MRRIPLDELAAMRAQGITLEAIALRFGCSSKTVERRLKKLSARLPTAIVMAGGPEVRRTISSINDVAEQFAFATLEARSALEAIVKAGDHEGTLRGAKALSECSSYVLQLYDRLMDWREIKTFQEDVMESINEEEDDVAERIFARIERRLATRQLLSPG